MEKEVNELMKYYKENGTFLEYIRLDYKDKAYRKYNLYKCLICGQETTARMNREPRCCRKCVNLSKLKPANVRKVITKYKEENN